jgi:hypothetical protein
MKMAMPAPLTTWLLERLTCSPQRESLIGDLHG